MSGSWRELESQFELDALPAFHRAFLTWRGVENADAMPLRRVQQRVEAELNKMVLTGDALRGSGDWELSPEVLEHLKARLESQER